MNLVERMKQELVTINRRLAEMELRRDVPALEFFSAYLADQVVVRRASGAVLGKYGEQGFMRSLSAPSPFATLRVADIAVQLVGTRALVTVMVLGVLRADGSEHRWRSVRLFGRAPNAWQLELWHDTEILD